MDLGRSSDAEVMNERNFYGVLEGAEKTVWEALKLAVDNFLARHKAPNYRQSVGGILGAYVMVGRNESLKTHVIHCHLDLFSTNRVDVSKESCERFHQDISTMARGYRGRWTLLYADSL
jgi:hypothetical protein